MRREPLVAPFLALAAGVLVGHFYYFRLNELAWPLACAAALLVVSLVAPKGRSTAPLCILFGFSLLGVGAQVLHRQSGTPKLNVADGEVALLDGCVIDPPVSAGDKSLFTLQIARSRSVRVTEIAKSAQPTPLRYGDRVEIAAKLRTPHNFQNPGEFDYAGWLAAQHIYWTATAAVDDLKVTGQGCGASGLRPVYDLRDWALRRLDILYPNDVETSGLLKAILLGQTAGIQRRWTSDFRLTGTYHALVISGQHVAVLALTLLFILRLFRLGRMPSLVTAAGVSWLYALVTGLSAPVVRAAGGFTLFLAASFLFRRVRILNGLATVGIAYLLLDPNELFDPSFQLSFLSAAALAVFALPLMERWTAPFRSAALSIDRTIANVNLDPRIATYRVELRLVAETLAAWLRLRTTAAQTITGFGARAAAFVVEAVLVSACVQFGLALPMIGYFHRISFTGLSANIIVVPLLSVVVPAGFAAIFTGWQWLAWVTALCLKLAEFVAGWHSHLEPSWRIAAVPISIALVFAAALVALAIALRTNHKTTTACAAVAIAIFAVVCWQPWKPELRPGWLEISAIDVSQGDSIFVAFPNGQTLLVDAGGFPGLGRMQQKPNLDMGEDVVSPYLWSRFVHRLDYVALTHGHSDHMQGMCSVLANFHPRELWIGPEPESQEWHALRQCASANAVTIKALSTQTNPMQFGNARLSVLAPQPDYTPGEGASNNDSLVLMIEMGKRSALLTGDAEKQVEAELVERCNLRPVTLLKVGHHGSRTSTTQPFLDAVKPQFGFISDGYMNQFHHPSPDVIARLEEKHTMLLRTDLKGLASFLTDGNHVEVHSYR